MVHENLEPGPALTRRFFDVATGGPFPTRDHQNSPRKTWQPQPCGWIEVSGGVQFGLEPFKPPMQITFARLAKLVHDERKPPTLIPIFELARGDHQTPNHRCRRIGVEPSPLRKE